MTKTSVTSTWTTTTMIRAVNVLAVVGADPEITPPSRRRHISVRRTFSRHPMGGYSLPREAADQLEIALKPLRNAEAAWTLGRFLARFHSGHRLDDPSDDSFAIDRRALSRNAELGLTEDQVRGAKNALVKVGFLDEVPLAGSTHRRIEGELRHKAKLYRFGPAYRPIFAKAKARQVSSSRRPIQPRPPVAKPWHHSRPRAAAKSPKGNVPYPSLSRHPYIWGRKPHGSIPRVSGLAGTPSIALHQEPMTRPIEPPIPTTVERIGHPEAFPIGAQKEAALGAAIDRLMANLGKKRR